MPCRIPALLLAAALFAAPAAAQKVTGKILPPAGGKAVAFDKVQVELTPLSMDYGQALRRLEGKTDPPLATARPRPDGSFEIVAPEPGLYQVTVRAEGFLPLRHLLPPLFEDVELPPVELEPAHPLEVRAAGPDGSPLSGAQVMVAARYRPSPWQPAESLGITGPDGRVVLPGAGGSSEVVAFSPRLGLQYVETRERAATLRFPAAKLVDLEVRDARGKKAAGALARFVHFSSPFFLTGPDGRLTLPLPKHEMPLLVETADGQAATLKLGPLSTGPRIVELAAPVTVSGKVLAADRRVPVPGALVWSGGARQVRAGEDGGFKIQLLRGYPEAGLLAAAPGYLPGYSSGSLRSGEGTSAPVTLLLAPVGAVTGRVVDAGGRPVSEAQIRIGGSGRSSGDLTGLQLRSGPDGSFRVPRLQAGETYELRVRKEGFAPASALTAAVPVRAPAAPVRIVLSPGGAVFGRTVDENGEPVAGATVELRPWEDPRRGGVRNDEPATGTATSGADGTFEVRHLPSGVFVLQARVDGFAPGVLNGIEVAAGTPRVDAGTVTLSPEAVVTGQVIDPRGAPIDGAMVWAFPERSRSFPSTLGPERRLPETGADGRFRIDGLPPGSRLRLSVHAQGYGNAELEGLELPLPEPLRIELRPLVQLTGRVADPAGEPVVGASLTLIKRHVNGSSGTGAGQTDDQGRFRIDVEPGPVEIQVDAQGYTDNSWRGTVPERGEIGPVEITLGRGAVLEGRVLDPAGNPIPAAFVSAFSETPSSEDEPFGRSSRTESDADGRYRIAGLEIGPHQINAQGRDGVGDTSRRFELQPGSNRLDLTLDMGVEISGMVRDEAGAPVSGAEVRLSPVASGREFGGVSAADGSFLLSAVTEGSYRITAR
ncbi:MAG TPA: carboxypeptidase-like regulatory domain-containing protein, partial [Thermoanaerobaculia bacterium]|nr:carboxypeptidase-like regulatory domain-containing protein [Thermoanaerobaculia bacterium]